MEIFRLQQLLIYHLFDLFRDICALFIGVSHNANAMRLLISFQDLRCFFKRVEVMMNDLVMRREGQDQSVAIDGQGYNFKRGGELQHGRLLNDYSN